MNSGTAWKPEELETLRKLASEGVSLERISIRLKRPKSAVRFKASEHGLTIVTKSQIRARFGLKSRDDGA
jgi:hypothetical protein